MVNTNEDFIENITTTFLRHIGSIERLKKSYKSIEKEKPVSDIGALVAYVIDLKLRKKDAEINGDLDALSKIEDIYYEYADNASFLMADKNIKVNQSDENEEISLSIESSLLRKAYSDYRESTLDLFYDDTQFQNSLIISLVIGMEILVAEIFKDYVNYMDISGQVLKDKKLDFILLKEIGSVEEAKTFLIDQYIEGLLRNSFQAWLEEFKKVINIDMYKLECVRESIKYINETFQRRHIIIHNDGQVNDLYLNKIDMTLRERYKKGEYILSDYEYIDERINTFRNFGLILIYQYGKKKHRQSTNDFFMELHGLLLPYLKEGFEATRYIFKDWFENQNLLKSSRGTSIINYYLTYKLNDDDSIIEDILCFNAEDYGEEFVFAKKILLGDNEVEDEAIKFLDFMDNYDFMNALNWPLFKLVKKSEKFKGFINDKIERIIKEEAEVGLIETK